MCDHAVVVGGGIAGLLAAHALVGRFNRVTIFERDRYPAGTSPSAPPARRGIAQSRCVHLLMAAGAPAFDELVPGWREQLVEFGASPFDASADGVVRLSGGALPRARSGITSYAFSRPLIESMLRRSLAGNPTVYLRQGRKVLGLLSSPSGERVIGVHIVERPTAQETAVFADLVVDASGARSTLSHWMARLPTTSVLQLKKTEVRSAWQYVSRWFYVEPAAAPDWHWLSVAPTAGAVPRAAMMLRAEENWWGVVLLTSSGESLPSQDAAFLEFADGLASGELRDVLARARPASPIHRYGTPYNRLVHFHRVSNWPAGLVALGDTVCALDPYFGLGMTTAARGAVLLGEYLDRSDNIEVGFFAFQKELAALNSQPWRLATGCDSDGHPLVRDNAFIVRVRNAAVSKAEVAHALLAVQHLLRPVESLMEIAL
jgi:2-polyprenyl-6-methoxyphenol hydroxylase-like FAD-dependent oxidoreductase